jgi:hypothetical protein
VNDTLISEHRENCNSLLDCYLPVHCLDDICYNSFHDSSSFFGQAVHGISQHFGQILKALSSGIKSGALKRYGDRVSAKMFKYV